MEVDPEAVSCECCGLEEECTGEYIGGVRAYFGGRWLCGLCSEAVKYEAGKCARGGGAGVDVEEAVRAHMAICRTLKGRGGPAGRVAEGMRQMLRTASWKKQAASSSAAAASPRGPTAPPPPRRCPSASDTVITRAAAGAEAEAALHARAIGSL